uniref:Uncharacterized protein n=1 Tax=Arundo donax TaxID=35708 RepID=A0A0A9BKV0_ARUDO
MPSPDTPLATGEPYQQCSSAPGSPREGRMNHSCTSATGRQGWPSVPRELPAPGWRALPAAAPRRRR